MNSFGYFLGIYRNLAEKLKTDGRFVIHAHCAYPDSVGVAIAAMLLRIPFFVTAHGSDINVYAVKRLIRPQVRWAFGRAAGVIAVSSALQQKIKLLLGERRTSVRVISCAAFDPGLFSSDIKDKCRAELGLQGKSRVITFVGQLVAIKGLAYLIDAWIALKKNRAVDSTDVLLIIGDGPLRDKLMQRCADAQVNQSVRFLGTISQKAVSRWVAASDVLCLPSQNEGTPNVVVEALASGVPVVASNVGGIPDLVKPGVNGYLVRPGEVDELANALSQSISRKWDAADISGSVAHMTWDVIAAKNIEFLLSISGGGNDSNP